MYDESFSTELCVTLAYSEVEAYFFNPTYDREFYSEPHVILAYLEPWYIQNPRHPEYCKTTIMKYFIQNLMWPLHIQSP